MSCNVTMAFACYDKTLWWSCKVTTAFAGYDLWWWVGTALGLMGSHSRERCQWEGGREEVREERAKQWRGQGVRVQDV